ncbi:MAG: FAD-binding oxidoreductase [Bacteroidales bacterium]|nr:FAD-binding oxidoreductase [Bacteroidales bacterium]
MNIDKFKAEVSTIVDKSRVYTDELRRLAWGTDAGFYKFMPQVILRSKDEGEVSAILKAASKYNVPVTFRAAGTSLSGQSVTDSVLVVAGKNWEQISTLDEGRTIRLQPGVIGSKVNDFLSGYGRKFGPDPASIKSAMIGGIVMNNASGMSCGTWANSDRMIISGCIVFADGTVLDTEDPKSRDSFMQSHPEIISGVEALYESAEFIWKFLRDRLTFTQTDTPVALHLTCSTKLMKIDRIVHDLACLCSSNVLVPQGVGCCGFAGDKGMTHPELNAYALRKLRSQIQERGIEVGYSNSRTCEIGLQTNSGIPYRSIVYLVNNCTSSRAEDF